MNMIIDKFALEFQLKNLYVLMLVNVTCLCSSSQQKRMDILNI